MSTRSVIEHALTVYYDGDAVLAGKVIDKHEHALAEKIRAGLEATGDWSCCAQARRGDADLIDPEVST